MKQQHSETKTETPGMGCKVILAIILGCFVLAGIIFFAGRSLVGDEATYTLFFIVVALITLVGGIFLFKK